MSNTGACAISGWIKKLATTKALKPKSEEIEEIFKVFANPNHVVRAIMVSTGSKKSITPMPVATPLPPSKLR